MLQVNDQLGLSLSCQNSNCNGIGRCSCGTFSDALEVPGWARVVDVYGVDLAECSRFSVIERAPTGAGPYGFATEPKVSSLRVTVPRAGAGTASYARRRHRARQRHAQQQERVPPPCGSKPCLCAGLQPARGAGAQPFYPGGVCITVFCCLPGYSSRSLPLSCRACPPYS